MSHFELFVTSLVLIGNVELALILAKLGKK